MISAVFRHGGDVSFIGRRVERYSIPAAAHGWTAAPSLLAAIGEVIGAYGNHRLPARSAKDRAEWAAWRHGRLTNLADGLGNGDAGGRKLPHCPKCGSPSLIRQEGCDLCTSCGYSKCG